MIINKRYKLVSDSPIAKGGFASVFTAVEISTLKEVVVKVNTDERVQDVELQTMMILKQKKFEGFSQLLDHGKLSENIVTQQKKNKANHYLVLEKLGQTLVHKQMLHFGKGFSLKTVAQIGLQLVDRLEKLHSLGLCHLDLKPDNICLGPEKDSTEIRLIDFGNCRRWCIKGKHVPQKQNVPMMGHPIFASVNTFRGATLSRRDDLQSLVYTLLYLLGRKLPWYNTCLFEGGSDKTTEKLKYKKIGRMKNDLSPGMVCGNSQKWLVPFLSTVNRYSFDEQPDYAYLKNLLVCAILKSKQVVDMKMDWSHDGPTKENHHTNKNTMALCHKSPEEMKKHKAGEIRKKKWLIKEEILVSTTDSKHS